jgi:hypothetical protein
MMRMRPMSYITAEPVSRKRWLLSGPSTHCGVGCGAGVVAALLR